MSTAKDRILQLQHQLESKYEKGEGRVKIGNVEVKVESGENCELIPSMQLQGLQENQEVLGHLRWMMQKGNLGQDMFLIGPPGPLRRRICMLYAQIRQIEVEYVALSRDVTESDLKQRREIMNGTAFYSDQACVRAAIHGRLLILDGVEKAERNVLPILNNLLENREMALEDGRFLMHHSKYDKLVSESLNPSSEKFVRTSEKFLCIALGLPTPKYDGYSLDPPFRSRFQARLVGPPSLETQMRHLTSSRKHSLPGLEQVVQMQQVLQEFNSDQGSPVPDFPIYLDRFRDLLLSIPGLHPRDCLELIYPFLEFNNADSQMTNIVKSVQDRFNLMKTNHSDQAVKFSQVNPEHAGQSWYKSMQFHLLQENRPAKKVSLNVPSGPLSSTSLAYFVETPYHTRCLTLLLLAHSVGDVCLVGEKGSGKSALTKLFASLLGYSIEFIPLYKDLSSRDLLQRRSTNAKGDTIWENSGLVKAALEGSIAILDPVDVLPLGTISSIQRLVMERELGLPDGRHLVNHLRYQELVNAGLSVSDLAKRGILPIHPAFRIIGIARPDKSSLKRGRWLNSEILSMFSFVPTRPMKIEEEEEVLKTLFPSIDIEKLQKVTRFAQALRMEKEDTMQDLASNFSTRQLIRLVRRLAKYPKDSLYSAIMKVSLFRFLPTLARDALSLFLSQHNIKPATGEEEDGTIHIEQFQNSAGKKMIKIGSVQAEVFENAPKMLIPSVLFFENDLQTLILQDILKDYLLEENLLLIGNQGVGKNKIIDYFLQLMQLPREYIQLHRDTTVYNLTSNPNIVNGLLVYEDSPLVKAVKEGSILVIDEVDKAPTHVTSILKSLIEDGEMVLADGRRILSAGSPVSGSSADITIHSDFRMICLANRPGYPFLGNDFYREIGDIFACHCIDNPDPKSELELLLNYAPGTPKGILEKLVASFNDLRALVEKGVINYPYSTRELVNVVKHLQVNNSDGISRALQNVFDFDVEQDVKEIIREVMNKNGIPTNMESIFKVELGAQTALSEPSLIENWVIGNHEDRVEEVSACLQDMLVRGTWQINIPKKWETLDQINGRSNVFSEWLYTFKLFSPGESSSDIMLGSDMYLYAISSAPVKLLIISPDHRTQKSIPLYEFIPSTKITKLSLFEVGIGKIAVFNSQEHSFVVVDLLAGTISTVLAKGLDPVHESFCTAKVSGCQYLFQMHSSSLVFFNLITLKQAILSVKNAGIQGLRHVQSVDGERWFLQATGGNKFFGRLLYLKKDQCTLHLEPILTTDTFKASEPNMVSNLESINGIWVNSSPPDCLGGYFEIREKESSSKSEVWSLFGWPRKMNDDNLKRVSKIEIFSSILKQSRQFVHVVPVLYMGVPRGILELVDPSSNRLVRVNVPISIPTTDYPSSKLPASDLFGAPKPELVLSVKKIIELPKGHILLLSHFGECMVFQSIVEQNEVDMKKWRALTGSLNEGALSISFEGTKFDSIILPPSSKSGNMEADGKGAAGESSDKDGEGGIGSGSGGPGKGFSDEARESGKIDDSFSLREIGEVSKITDAQMEMHRVKFKERLKHLNMSEKDYNTFSRYKKKVEREIRELRAILETVEAKNKERIWKKNQVSGDIDDDKLVEGLSGERAIYRLRGENDDELFQTNPKRMFFAFDLSASMMRFNGHDGRMDRSLECALMIMEAFKGFEHKFSYKLFGHSGDGPALELIPSNVFPKNEKEIFDVLHRMQSHASYTMSGDNTVAAISSAVKNVTAEEGDDYFVLVLSDANLHQYNISSSSLNSEMQADSRVNCYMIFLGNISNQANRISDGLNGQSFNCFDTSDLPKIMKSIFLKAMLK